MGSMRKFLVVVGCLLVPVWCFPANLVMNGGFESVDEKDVPENWAVRAWTTNTIGKAAARRGTPSGKYCMEVTVAAGKAVYGCFSRAIDVSEVNTRYLLFSYRYRTVGALSAQAMVVSFDEDFMAKQWETRPLADEARGLRQSRAWKTHTWRVEMRPGTKQIVVVFQVLEAGTLLIDDVVLRPSPDEVQWEGLDIGRMEKLPSTRRASLRLSNTTPDPVNITLTLSAWRGRKRTAKVRQKLTLGTDVPETIRITYRYPANQSHEVTLEVADTDSGEMLLYERRTVPGLIDAHLEVPAFRGTVTSSTPVPEIIVEGRLFAVPEIVKTATLSGRLLGTGAEISEGAGITRNEDGTFRAVFPTEGLLIGDHQVRLDAAGGKRTIASISLPVRRTKAFESEVTCDAQRRLWVNGERIFPIGIYYVMTTEDLDAVQKAGFNTVVIPSPKASYLLAEAAAAKGMGFIIESPSVRRDFWERRQDKFGPMPAFIGWQVVQRPDAKLIHPDMMLALYQILEEVSPNHPVMTALRHADSMAQYAKATDIIIPWILPVPREPVTRIADAVETARAAGGGKPVWALIQAAGNAWATDRTLDDQANGRHPTIDEVRAMAYLALMHGADGLLFYAHQLQSSDKQRHFRIREDTPEIWEGLPALTAELAQVGPAIAGSKETILLPPAADGLIHLAKWTDGEQTFVIAVNTAAEPTVTTFDIPACESTQLDVMFEDRALTSQKKGSFGDVFAPHGVHIYSIK